MKKGLIVGGAVVGLLVVIVAGVVAYVLSNLDSLVKEAVETHGSAVTQAKVTLNEVKIEATSGAGALRGLTVGNPAGFKTPSAFELGQISIQIDSKSIGSDPIVIRDILIGAPKITYEMGSGGSNIDALQRNVDTYMKRMGAGGGAAKDDAAKKDGAKGEEGPKLVIENLRIKDAVANVSATFMGGKTMSLNLPDMHLKDIGKKSGGASPGEVIQKVISSIGDNAGKAVSSIDLGGAVDKVKEGAAGAMDAVKGGASSVGDKVKKLFGN